MNCGLPLLPILALFLLPRNEAFAPSHIKSLGISSRFSSSLQNADATDVSLDQTLLKGVKTMSKVMTPEFFESSSLLKTMYNTICKNVEIKESTISGAGQGLFATRNIKSGTIVSFYPAHALGIDGDDGSSLFRCFPHDEDYFREHPAPDSSYLHCTDQPLFERTCLLAKASQTFQDTPLYLDVNPNSPVVPGWVSQYINDGAVVQANSEQGLLDYYDASAVNKNCIHIPWGPSPVMATVTTRKVKKGQELFTSYGGTYWLGVYLGIHGEEGVPITPAIQQKIQETAVDLKKGMNAVSVVYARQAEEMEVQFNKVHQA